MHDKLSSSPRQLQVEADIDEVQSVDSVDVFPHQVGGHHVIVKHPTKPNLIVKPFFNKEVQFYEDAKRNPDLQSVISKYYGRINLTSTGECIVIEDLTFGMAEPCILDIKIGKRLHDDDATPEKALRMKKKSECSTSGLVGFRISGMRFLDPSSGDVTLRLKSDMRGLKMDQLFPTMLEFFSLLQPDQTLQLIRSYIVRLNLICDTVRNSNSHLYSSSILFVYDHEDPKTWDCRMIDFVHSHIFPDDEHVQDLNYLEGMTNLINYLQRIETTILRDLHLKNKGQL